MEKLVSMNLEDIVGDRFGSYSKYIIQDRALPDVRDGLKPVQRRIIYAMVKDRNTFDKPYRKSAKTVGNVIGNLHPHGDSSVYDAMIRMSQDFKMRIPLLDMHGNKGSIDGDPAAAMRYTEARLAKYATLLFTGIEKECVEMIYNFDDTMYEPTVLPTLVPNLLVNGSMGISSGYATNIPPHNLNEVLEACILFLQSKPIDEVLSAIKGPDFPTGGIVSTVDDITNAQKLGKGRIQIQCKYEIVKKRSKEQIIITEIPYEVNKATLVYKIAEVIEGKKISGITEVRDESDREGIRIVIDLKKDADSDLIIKYLLKTTDLQVYYNYNMVAIVDRKPQNVSVLNILEAYLKFAREVLVKKMQYDYQRCDKRLHILEGLIKALSILDEVITLIRASANKQDAINNLVIKYDFTQEQSEAIVNLQLYRLTNTDIVELRNEKEILEKEISRLTKIIESKRSQTNYLIKQFKDIIEQYGISRKSEIREKSLELKIDKEALIKDEEVVIGLTKDGYVKSFSTRVFTSNDLVEYRKKDDDYLLLLAKSSTLNKLVIFLSSGKYLIIPIHEILDSKWKGLGQHISSFVSMLSTETIVNAFVVNDFDETLLSVVTANGYAKNVSLESLNVLRYNKTYTYMKLIDDEVVAVNALDGSEIVFITHNGYGMRVKASEIAVQSAKSKGVIAIKLVDDKVVCSVVNSQKYLVLLTSQNYLKKLYVDDLVLTKKNRKGNLVIRKLKSKDLYIEAGITLNAGAFNLCLEEEIKEFSLSNLTNHGIDKNGSKVIEETILNLANYCELISIEEKSNKDNEKLVQKNNAEIEETEIEEEIIEYLTIDDLI